VQLGGDAALGAYCVPQAVQMKPSISSLRNLGASTSPGRNFYPNLHDCADGSW